MYYILFPDLFKSYFSKMYSGSLEKKGCSAYVMLGFIYGKKRQQNNFLVH